ncbi:hypothetical protein SLEP1_g49628 [Rubroshorea leprosula]|uniref:Uncharacterized protein n=1 Tax=Rubroshorea leprosula TaxID=152421 RepID=A0AAV5LZX2_9ROSI|nr:hypothetical protein SLEP1_g49628 [Rubroshorea leprosula]
MVAFFLSFFLSRAFCSFSSPLQPNKKPKPPTRPPSRETVKA